jgi:hypothetical protein
MVRSLDSLTLVEVVTFKCHTSGGTGSPRSVRVDCVEADWMFMWIYIHLCSIFANWQIGTLQDV